jgi:glyoxylase-like metal-dependent hydrolase (beta-lactamase superfamily II)
MKISERVHQIRVDFLVTKEIKRYVYLYLIEGTDCYLIDSGVAGSEKIVEAYMKEIGQPISALKWIFLTHAHPDHIGGAAGLQQRSGCRIAAAEEERNWIEDIGLQYRQRPIPNFDQLVNQAVRVTERLTPERVLLLEPGLTIKCHDCSGHSVGSLGYELVEDQILFSGDAIPCLNDLPIYLEAKKSLDTLNMILQMRHLQMICPAWDHVYFGADASTAVLQGIQYINQIDDCVKKAKAEGEDLNDIARKVSQQLGMEAMLGNPLFLKTIKAHN